MVKIPDNIVSILGVDNAGATTTIDVASFVTSVQAVTATTPVTSQAVVQKQTIVQPAITTNTTIALSIDADPNYITKVNKNRDNLDNSILYESNKKIGLNTIVPSYLFDIYGGSLNVTPVKVDDGYKLSGINFAYPNFTVATKETIVIGHDSLLPRASIYTLVLRGLIATTSPTTQRTLSVDDLGVVSALSLTSGSVIYSNGIGLVQDNNNFFYDATNKRLGIGNKIPTEALHVTGSIRQSVVTTAMLKADSTGKIVAATLGTDYINTISGITAGGELSGTYPNPIVLNSSVIGKVLTGYSTLSGTVSASDTILQAFGKVQAQLNALSGSLIYKGSWNASTNTPTITSGTGTNGNYYIVSVAGTTTIDGISSWAVGDWIVFNGTVWQKIANQSVTSVNGFSGIVTLTTANISEVTNLYYTNARGIASTLTGYTSGTGTITSSDTILSAIQKLNGNIGALVTGVSSVSGTTNRITVSPTTGAVVVDIATTYVGQSSITTLGTITTGVWTATAISDTYISSASTWNAKEPAIAAGTTLQYWRGDKSWQTLPIYTLSGLGGEPAIASGTTLQYWRGDKSWQTLPIYTLSGLGGEPAIASGTTLQYWRGDKSWQTLPIYTLSGLGGVPTSRTLTINGVAYDLSLDRSWTISAISGLTTNKIPKASSSSTLADSNISDDGTTVSVGLPISVTGAITSTSRISASGANSLTTAYGGYYIKYSANASSRSWLTGNDSVAYGDFAIMQSTTQTGSTYVPWIYVSPSGNVGLGNKTNPAYTLDVTGDVNVSGTFRVNGVAIGTGSSGSITGSGTATRIARWNGTTSLDNGIIRDNGSSVTIGSDNFVYKLAVNPIGTSFFGFGYAGTESMFLNAVSIVSSSVVGTVPLVYNAREHTWITDFNQKMFLSNSGQLFVNTTGVSGGGTVQVSGSINITGGQFLIDGVAITSGGGGGGGNITGSGSSNYLTMWNGSTSITSSGIYFNGTNYGIGTTSPAYKLDVNGSINVTGAFYVNGSPIGGGSGGVGGGGTTNKVARWTASNTLGDSSIYDAGAGSIAVGNTSPSYQIDVTGIIRATGDIIITSDRRKKENIKTIENALDTIMNLRGVTYNKINDTSKRKQIGFIAQEVLPYVPEVVYSDNEDYFGVAYQNMVALLTEAVKEQQKQIEELKAKLL